jgi:hypothetical protein
MNIRVQGRTEPRDCGDGAALGVGDSLAGRGATQPGEHAADEHVQHGGGQLGVKGKLIAKREGQRQHPLAHGHPGDDAIDQLGGQFAHAAGPARGAEAPAFAAESNDHFISALLAPDMHATVLEPATAQGETDYASDYRGTGGQAISKGHPQYDSYTLASRALKRALDNAGLSKDDLDGLCTANISGERASELWGLNPRWSGSGDAAQCIIEATLAINAGLCTTVALVYGNAQRSMNTAYGGPRVTGGGITSYFYYAPWG